MRNDLNMNESIYNSYLQITLNRLREQKAGTRVITYYGLGAALPDEYDLKYQKAVGSDFLKVWKKKSVSIYSIVLVDSSNSSRNILEKYFKFPYNSLTYEVFITSFIPTPARSFCKKANGVLGSALRFS